MRCQGGPEFSQVAWALWNLLEKEENYIPEALRFVPPSSFLNGENLSINEPRLINLIHTLDLSLRGFSELDGRFLPLFVSQYL